MCVSACVCVSVYVRATLGYCELNVCALPDSLFALFGISSRVCALVCASECMYVRVCVRHVYLGG